MLVTIKLIIIGIVLLIASIQDLKSREVDDKIWIITIPIGLLLTIIEALTTLVYPYILAIFSIIFSIIMALGFAYLGLYGGADAKALITIALTLPLPPDRSPLIFPMTILGNALFILIIILPFIMTSCLIWNLIIKTKGIELFSNLKINNWKKLIVMLFGVKVKAKIAYSIHFNLMERIGKNGSREIKILRKVEENIEKIEGEYLWATPALPFIVFIFAGYLIYFIYGDLLFTKFLHFFLKL
ncbi:MAG: A24 family peptidase C-terminal domain-containing protein [Candidatus Methanomethylicaceae archaeon]|nr:A24 family peptidase C-terminal domain-containing protein [Candidatus Verstraetearchaeota archaeon]